jgi:mannose-1-phosphate guanylyltransferase
MKAMILAAGLGTRLLPLTNNVPKALVPINGKPLLEIIICKLRSFGFDDVIINVHHFADQIIDFLKANNYFDIHISISDERAQLLDTGGGLKKASWFFNDNQPFLLYNVDIISDIDLKKLFLFHQESDALVTLAVRNRKTSRYFLFDDSNSLCGWKNFETGEIKIVRNIRTKIKLIAFSGIHIINPDIFELITEEGSFSLIDKYLALAKSYKIQGFNHTETQWIDIGKIGCLEEAEKLLSGKV